MKPGSLLAGAVYSALLISGSVVFGASLSPALLKGKQEAEGRGCLFETSHDEIVASTEEIVQLWDTLPATRDSA
jgi:hypothetical protein